MALPHSGQFLGHAEGFARLPFFHHFQDVRNHFAGTLDQHGVADVHAKALDFIHVVQAWSG